MKRRAAKVDYNEGNRIAADIILADPDRYAGGLLDWAHLWVKNHSNYKPKSSGGGEMTIEERLAAHDARKQKKRIASRRERWKSRKWSASPDGTYFTNVHQCNIFLYPTGPKDWKLRIQDKLNGNLHFSQKIYRDLADAQMGGFDALLYVEGKRSTTHTAFAFKQTA